MRGTIITKKGIQLIAKLVASGEVLVFSRAVVGTGRIPDGTLPEDMEALVQYKMDGSIASISSAGNKASVVFQVSSIGVPEEFDITEAGLYAEDPDEGDILYSYFDMSEDPQHIYAEGSEVAKFFETTMTVIIGTVESVDARLDPSSLVTTDVFNEELNNLKNVILLDIPHTNWEGSVAPYTQNVTVAGVTEDMEPILVKASASGMSEAAKKAYNKAFNLINDADDSETGNGYVTFRVYKKTETTIRVGLKGV